LEHAAAYLSVTERHLRRIVYERRIAYLKVGGRLRFLAEDLDAFLRSCRIVPSHPAAEAVFER
jgi:excisionase family DNA binding protein